MTHRRRLGVPSARNTGIEHVQGRYLAFLDDDDVFLPPHLATALAGLESGVDAVATTCLVAEHRVDPTTPVHDTVAWDVGFDPLLLGLTLQHTNREVLVEGPAITIRPVSTRRLVAGGSR